MRSSFVISVSKFPIGCRRRWMDIYGLLSIYKCCSLMSPHGIITREGKMRWILLQDSSGVTFPGGTPLPLRLRKKRTLLPNPSAPSEGSTHWQVRALVHIALMKPQGPPSTLER